MTDAIGRKFEVSNVSVGHTGESLTLTLLKGNQAASYTITSPIQVGTDGSWTIGDSQGTFTGKVNTYAPLVLKKNGVSYVYSMSQQVTFDSKGNPVLPSGNVTFTLTRAGVATTNTVSLSGNPQPDPYSSNSESRVFIDPTNNAVYSGVFSNGSFVTDTMGRRFLVSDSQAGQGGQGGQSVTLTLVQGTSLPSQEIVKGFIQLGTTHTGLTSWKLNGYTGVIPATSSINGYMGPSSDKVPRVFKKEGGGLYYLDNFSGLSPTHTVVEPDKEYSGTFKLFNPEILNEVVTFTAATPASGARPGSFTFFDPGTGKMFSGQLPSDGTILGATVRQLNTRFRYSVTSYEGSLYSGAPVITLTPIQGSNTEFHRQRDGVTGGHHRGDGVTGDRTHDGRGSSDDQTNTAQS